MQQPLSIEESRQLLRLCQAGKLYEVDAWIAADKSLEVSTEMKKTPLRIAVECGFHSLVKLLALHSENKSVLNDALSAAVDQKSLELVELLLMNGAEIRGIPFTNVLFKWNPELIQYFLDHGADVLTDQPFAAAFGEKVRTALSRFVRYRKEHPEHSEQLQEQLDRPLRYFSREGDLKWVSLLMWAGGNPRSLGPVLYEDDDPDLYVTALQEAVLTDHVDVLKRLKPDRTLDDLTDLLHWATILPEELTIRYLLEIGANPNGKENGGSAAFDRCLSRMDFTGRLDWHTKGLLGIHAVYRSFDSLRALAERGAKWRPDDRSQMNLVLRTLLKCEPEVTRQFMQLLLGNDACTEETLKELFSSPRMREHMSGQNYWFARFKLKELLIDPKLAKRQAKAGLPRSVSPQLLARYNREQLFEQVWSKPMTTVAHEYGVSDVALAKTCKKLFIPVPGRGYWAKKTAGRVVPARPKLKPVARQ